MVEERTLKANLTLDVEKEELDRLKSQFSDLTSDLDLNIEAPDLAEISGASSDAQMSVEEAVREMTALFEEFESHWKDYSEEMVESTQVIEENSESKWLKNEDESNPSSFKGLIKDKMKDMKEGISSKLMEVGGEAIKAIATVVAVIVAVSGILKKAWDMLVESSPFLSNILRMFSQALNLILGPLGTAIGIELVPVLKSMYERIMKGVQAIWKAYEEDGLSGMIKETFNVLWEVFEPLIPEIAEVIGTVMWALLRTIGELWWDNVKSFWTEDAPKAIADYFKWWFDRLIGFAEEIYDVVRTIAGGIKGVGEDIWDGIKGAFGFAEGGVVEPVPGGRLVRVAEAGEREWIIPESKMGDVLPMSSSGGVVNYYITVNGYTDTDLTEKIVSVIDQRTDMARALGGF